jgi:hypothetical protein
MLKRPSRISVVECHQYRGRETRFGTSSLTDVCKDKDDETKQVPIRLHLKPLSLPRTEAECFDTARLRKRKRGSSSVEVASVPILVT